MKMPRRTFFPIYKQPNDILGLQHLTLMGEACETDSERQRRIAKVEAGVADAFKAAVHHLGEDEARQLFSRVMRRPKRGRGKTLAPDRDACLLKAYDEAVANGESIASVAKRLHGEGHELGATEGAIAAQIRKLRDERKQRARAAAVQSRWWRMATRNEPPTLLSEFMREK
jgi:hypothetical protein